ncbi:MAG: tyrosine-type recombinase/integrase [Chloroflexota bacterium]|nr:tyrosine-type recombinase/integrase [Chloroflexota bacterium]
MTSIVSPPGRRGKSDGRSRSTACPEVTTKERRVALSKQARQALQVYLEVRPDWPTEQLFFSRTGKPLATRDVQRLVEKLARLAGIARQVTPHTLRHSFAKNLVNVGVGLEKVATLLGHESLETTRVYTTPSEADLQAATEKVTWKD